MIELGVNTALLREKIALCKALLKPDPVRPAMRFIWGAVFCLGIVGSDVWEANLVPNAPYAGPAIVGCAVFGAVYAVLLLKRLDPGRSWRRAVSP